MRRSASSAWQIAWLISKHLALYHSDLLALPLRLVSVSRVVCDLPVWRLGWHWVRRGTLAPWAPHHRPSSQPPILWHKSQTDVIMKIIDIVLTAGIISFSMYEHFTRPSDGSPITKFRDLRETKNCGQGQISLSQHLSRCSDDWVYLPMVQCRPKVWCHSLRGLRRGRGPGQGRRGMHIGKVILWIFWLNTDDCVSSGLGPFYWHTGERRMTPSCMSI